MKKLVKKIFLLVGSLAVGYSLVWNLSAAIGVVAYKVLGVPATAGVMLIPKGVLVSPPGIYQDQYLLSVITVRGILVLVIFLAMWFLARKIKAIYLEWSIAVLAVWHSWLSITAMAESLPVFYDLMIVLSVLVPVIVAGLYFQRLATWILPPPQSSDRPNNVRIM